MKDLSEALDKAKARREVFSKTIIWESGVSKSQFYRIIKGQEAPSAETKLRIQDSLGLDSTEFDRLFEQSKLRKLDATGSKPISAAAPDRSFRRPIIAVAAIAVVVAMLVGLNSPQIPNTSPLQANVVVEEDKTLFIKDVTIPDGTAIPVNTTYVKTWRVQNIGNVVWKNRYLKRITPPSDLICSSPAMVPIPETAPGEIIDISVTFKTPHLPGSCRTDWKTSDVRGNLYFPDMHSLFSIVTVVDAPKQMQRKSAEK